ncbi:MAG: GNAT family N-acetyltransferase [Verrucomicrobia bacterium]|nr:MAG: GNAT family N-acetyltransferase [Verrucomicrobiota bacterium]
MTGHITDQTLPSVPDALPYGDVVVRFAKIVPADAERGFVPYYYFRILTVKGEEVGHVNFRVGDTEHIRLYAGHIGFQIQEAFRGRGYAWQACRAVAPFVRSIYESVIITCDPDNHASRRTIERLGAAFIEEVRVPASDPNYERGSRVKRRYIWKP